MARAYRDANDLLGDIVKVTPSSKVVGDLALMMVAQNLAAADVVDPGIDIAFPASVVEMLRGDLGNPPGGWPGGIQTKVLQDELATTVRPGSLIDAADLDKERATAERLCDMPVDDRELASYLMYPRMYAEYCSAERKYGPVSALPTDVFFYGMKPGDEVSIQIELGKILLVRFQALTATDEDGEVKVFFELNGQPRTIKVPDRTFAGERTSRRKADEDNEGHVAAPMPGTISSMQVRSGDRVKAGDTLLTLEAMKMETALRAPRDGTVAGRSWSRSRIPLLRAISSSFSINEGLDVRRFGLREAGRTATITRADTSGHQSIVATAGLDKLPVDPRRRSRSTVRNWLWILRYSFARYDRDCTKASCGIAEAGSSHRFR